MRKLLNTLFVTSENRYLSLKNENVVVHEGEQIIAQFPLISLEGIVSFSYQGASPALMGACAKRGIGLVFMSPNGRFLCRVSGIDQGNVLLRRQQCRVAEDDAQCARIARNMIIGKIYNERWVLGRALRDHGMRLDQAKIEDSISMLQSAISSLQGMEDTESIRGVEGGAAAQYYRVFDELILSQKADFIFQGRNRQPPLDNVNALLSFAYVLLAHECASALESVGIDAYIGFLHKDRPGRASLALDLEEELRAPFADRLVLTLINNRVIQDKHFDRQEDGAVLLSGEGRRVFLRAWQEKKQETLTHPYLQEKIPWGLVPYVQSLLLARYLRGDLDGYPPFLWK